MMKLKEEKGTVLAVAILIAVILAGLGIALMLLLFNQSKATFLNADTNKALMIADGAISKAIVTLKSNANWTGESDVSFGGGVYDTTVTPLPNPRRITATAWVPNKTAKANRTVETFVNISTIDTRMWNYAGFLDKGEKSWNPDATSTQAMTWTSISTGTTNPINLEMQNQHITALKVDPVNSSIIYAGSKGGKIYKTTNGGTDWYSIKNNLPNDGIRDIEVINDANDPQNTTKDIVYVGFDGSGVWKSTTGGEVWTQVNYMKRWPVWSRGPTSPNATAFDYGNSIDSTTISRARPALADLDNDQDMDLLVGASDGKCYALENTNTKWEPTWSRTDKAKKMFPTDAIIMNGNARPTFGDLDQDGDPDLIIGRQDGYSWAYQNVGTSNAIQWNYTSSIYPNPPNGGEVKPDFANNLESGLTGYYYNGMAFNTLALTRNDETVNFDWGAGSPDPRVGVDIFSVRWLAAVKADYNETYTFYTVTDDGVRLWVDGSPIIDKWIDQGPTEWSGSIYLTQGYHSIKMEYYENGGGAVATLSWSSASVLKAIIPLSNLGGNLDMLVGAADGFCYGYRNSLGTYTYDSTIAIDLPDQGSYAKPALSDLDGDGKTDVLIGNSDGYVKAYKNNGFKNLDTFIGWTNRVYLTDINSRGDDDDRARPALADLNNDGKIDMLSGVGNGTIYGFNNIGTTSTPNWTRDATAANWEMQANNLPIDVGKRSAPTFIDLDSDGGKDMIIGSKDDDGDTMCTTTDLGVAYRNRDKDDGALDGQYTGSNPQYIPGGLLGTYYNSTTLGSSLYGTRIDRWLCASGDWTVNNGWLSPYGNAFNYDKNCSVRWGGKLDIKTLETYYFKLVHDDGAKLYVDDMTTPKIDQWGNCGTHYWNGSLSVGLHDFKVEWKNAAAFLNLGSYCIQLSWSSNSETGGTANWQIIPSEHLCAPCSTSNIWVRQHSWDLNVAEFAGDYNNRPSAGDLNGDGKLDLLVGGAGTNIYAYKNQWDGAKPNWTRMNGTPNWETNIQGTDWAAPCLGDLDGDGDNDVLVGFNGTDDGIAGYRNDDPAFGGSTSTGPVWVRDTKWDSYEGTTDSGSIGPALGDFYDNDGDLDCVKGDYNGKVYYWRHNSTGKMSKIQWIRRTDWEPNGTGYDFGSYAKPAFGNLNNSGGIDLMIGENGGTCSAFSNSSTTSPSWTYQSGWNISTGLTQPSPSFANLDTDGFIDAMIGASDGMVYGYRNIGSSTAPNFQRFDSWDNYQTQSSSYASPFLYDFSGDGKCDMRVGMSNGYIYYYINGGSVGTTVSWQRMPSWDPPDVGDYATPYLADFLGNDGKLDLAIGEYVRYGRISFYKNNSTYPLTGGLTWNLHSVKDQTEDYYIYSVPALADLDSDGDKDLVVGLRTDTTFGCECGGEIPPSDYTIAVKNIGTASDTTWTTENKWNLGDVGEGGHPSPYFADLDADGDNDVMMGKGDGNTRAYVNRFNRVYEVEADPDKPDPSNLNKSSIYVGTSREHKAGTGYDPAHETVLWKTIAGGGGWNDDWYPMAIRGIGGIREDKNQNTCMAIDKNDPSLSKIQIGGIRESSNGYCYRTENTSANTLPGTANNPAGNVAWSAKDGGGTSGVFASTISSLYMSPADNLSCYAGNASGALYRTTDGGTNWSSASSPTTNRIYGIVVDSTNFNEVTIGTKGGDYEVEVNGDGVWKTYNINNLAGYPWTRCNTGFPKAGSQASYPTLVQDPRDSSTYYIGLTSNSSTDKSRGVYKGKKEEVVGGNTMITGAGYLGSIENPFTLTAGSYNYYGWLYDIGRISGGAPLGVSSKVPYRNSFGYPEHVGSNSDLYADCGNCTQYNSFNISITDIFRNVTLKPHLVIHGKIHCNNNIFLAPDTSAWCGGKMLGGRLVVTDKYYKYSGYDSNGYPIPDYSSGIEQSAEVSSGPSISSTQNAITQFESGEWYCRQWLGPWDYVRPHKEVIIQHRSSSEANNGNPYSNAATNDDDEDAMHGIIYNRKYSGTTTPSGTDGYTIDWTPMDWDSIYNSADVKFDINRATQGARKTNVVIDGVDGAYYDNNDNKTKDGGDVTITGYTTTLINSGKDLTLSNDGSINHPGRVSKIIYVDGNLTIKNTQYSSIFGWYKYNPNAGTLIVPTDSVYSPSTDWGEPTNHKARTLLMVDGHITIDCIHYCVNDDSSHTINLYLQLPPYPIQPYSLICRGTIDQNTMYIGQWSLGEWTGSKKIRQMAFLYADWKYGQSEDATNGANGGRIYVPLPKFSSRWDGQVMARATMRFKGVDCIWPWSTELQEVYYDNQKPYMETYFASGLTEILSWYEK